MNEIWANRLVAGTKAWTDVPEIRRAGVKAALAMRIAEGAITSEQYKTIIGDEWIGE